MFFELGCNNNKLIIFLYKCIYNIMSFFKKLAGSGKTLLKKVSGGVDSTLRNIGNTAGDIGAGLDKGVPMLSMIDPELGAGLCVSFSRIQTRKNND